MLDLQAFLDGMVEAMHARDFGALAALYSLPLVVIVQDGTVVVEDEADLRAGFEGFLASLEGHGVTDHVRIATGLHHVTPQLASGTYDTHLMRNGQRVLEPFATSMMLRREGEAWKAVSVMNAVTQDRWRFKLPVPSQVERT